MNVKIVADFLQFVEDTPTMQQKFNGLDFRSEAGEQQLLAIAAGAGYHFTLDEWRAVMDEIEDDAISGVEGDFIPYPTRKARRMEP